MAMPFRQAADFQRQERWREVQGRNLGKLGNGIISYPFPIQLGEFLIGVVDSGSGPPSTGDATTAIATD